MANPTHRVLWWALAVSLLIYAGVAWLMARPPQNDDMLPVLTAVFAAVSAGIAIFSFAYRRRALSGPIQAGRLDPSTPEGLAQAFPPFIVNLVLSESVGILGLVLALISGRPVAALPFIAGALGLLFLHRPTAPDLAPPISGRPLGDRPPPIG